MKRRSALATVLLLVVSSRALAQTSAEGAIRGYVKDEQRGALAGVTLTATSPTVPGKYTVLADAEGYYRLLNLPPGSYSITAELTGFSKFVRSEVVVRAGLNLLVDIVMKVGAVAETVEVTHDTPMVESRSAVQALNVDGDFQRALPLSITKHWSNFLAITPGVAVNQSQGTAGIYYLRGASFASQVIQIDGADMASVQQNSTLYVSLPTEVIADVQVKTGGMDASTPLGVGAVMNVATKSGSNDLRGVVGASFQKRRWSDNNNPGGSSAAVDALLPEAALGGPLVRDRFWFFGSYRYERIVSGVTRSPQQIATLKALKPDFEPFDSEVSGSYVFTKLSGSLSAKHQGDLSYAYDPQQTQTVTAIDAGQFVDNLFGGDKNFALRLNSAWRSGLTTRLGASYNNKTFEVHARRDVPSRPVFGTVTAVGGQLAGSGQIATLDNGNTGRSTEQPFSKYTISGDVTWFRAGWAGGHELQAGVYLQPKNHVGTVSIYANDGFAREAHVLRDQRDPSRGSVPFWREVFDVGRVTSTVVDSRDLAFYLQDAWTPTTRLTINAGVRLDRVKRIDKLFDVVTQDSTDVGPRFGVNYSLTADRKNVARASWLRAHDALSSNVASAGSNIAGKRDLYDVNLDGVFEAVFITPASTALVTNRILDPDRGQPYIDEWMLGYRRQFPGRLTADVSFIHRDYRARTALIDRNGIYENGVFKGYRDERLNEIYELTANRWNWHVYSGLEAQVVKDSAKLRFVGAYTRSWRHLAGTWQPNDPASFLQPDAFPNDKGVGTVRTFASSPDDSNSLSGTHMTIDSLAWVDHIARGGIVWSAPWNLVVASNYIYQSGPYGGPVVNRIAAPDPRFGPATVTLASGRRVSNPLATTIRFAYPTRGEGQLQLPALHVWNLRLGRDFSLGAQRRLGLAVDLMNVVNAAADQAFQSGGNQVYSPNLGRTQTRQSPRAVRLSARLTF